MFSVQPPPPEDDAHLEVTVTPSASAFYAGEVFSAVITLRNTNVPIHTHHHSYSTPPSPLPGTPNSAVSAPGHLNLLPGSAATSLASATPTTPSASSTDRPWSPVTAGTSSTGWRGHARRPSGKGHTRRAQSLGLGKNFSPQEMVWALDGGMAPPPPPLPPRRTMGSIPMYHPHARQVSVASTAFYAPTDTPGPSSPGLEDKRSPRMQTPDTAPSQSEPSASEGSARATPSPSPSLPDVMEEKEHSSSPSTASPDTSDGTHIAAPQGAMFARSLTATPPTSSPRNSPHPPALSFMPPTSASSNQVSLNSPPLRTGPSPSNAIPARSPLNPAASSQPLQSASSLPNPGSPSAFMASSPSSPAGPTFPSGGRRVSHGRTASYQNAYGSSMLTPPPQHPSARDRPPLQNGTTTILWAHTRLVARFAPSHQYIPPDPLLPLKARMLHQPVGSGSLSSGDTKKHGSRWSLSFGTGTIGQSTQPSLTGSLFGLAKGLVMGGSGGSLEEERKRVWNTQDLPVLETTRSLLGVDIKLGEGETREFVYTLQLPASLPPAFKGKALRFSYELLVSLTVSLPGPGKRQRTKDIVVPVRVWPNVSLQQPLRTYDVLLPVIQTSETGTVGERAPTPATGAATLRRPADTQPQAKIDSLPAYARQLLDAIDAESPQVPPSPTRTLMPMPPSAPTPLSPRQGPQHLLPSGRFLLPDPATKLRSRSTSIVAGDDELVEECPKCGEAVEILSRHSPKASYDIRHEGEIVAVLTLIKTSYRLGETVLGVVTFRTSTRRVLKFSALLETHEVIPEPLLPPGRRRRPELRRVHAEHCTAYAQHTSRVAFSLDIPSDATPAFALAAGEGGRSGGLEWRVRLSFLVASPRKPDSSPADGAGVPQGMDGRRISLGAIDNKQLGRKSVDAVLPGFLSVLPTQGDADNAPYTASPNLTPLVSERGGFADARAELVECEIPVTVLAGNTAFVVRPSVNAM